MKTKKQLDKRDRKLLHKIWLTVTWAIEKQSQGHSDGWDDVQKALDKAVDEMGDPEDFRP
jgi:hypothetical protein